jgi:hypothetical protein
MGYLHERLFRKAIRSQKAYGDYDCQGVIGIFWQQDCPPVKALPLLPAQLFGTVVRRFKGCLMTVGTSFRQSVEKFGASANLCAV